MARRNCFDAKRNFDVAPGLDNSSFWKMERWEERIRRILYIMVYLDGERERIVWMILFGREFWHDFNLIMTASFRVTFLYDCFSTERDFYRGKIKADGNDYIVHIICE